MDKLKAIAAPFDHYIEPTMKTELVEDRLSQAEFNDGLKELCSQFSLPDSLITALIIGNVANLVNRAEGKDSKFNTLTELSQCLRNGDGNWMQFIPEYKSGAVIYTDRLDIGLTRAFYSFAVSQGLDPIDAFNVTKARSKDIQEFLKHASAELHTFHGKVSTAWYNYSDLAVFAARRVLGNPIKPADFKLQSTPLKGLNLS